MSRFLILYIKYYYYYYLGNYFIPICSINNQFMQEKTNI